MSAETCCLVVRNVPKVSDPQSDMTDPGGHVSHHATPLSFRSTFVHVALADRPTPQNNGRGAIENEGIGNTTLQSGIAKRGIDQPILKPADPVPPLKIE
jgi:hypothetical protein